MMEMQGYFELSPERPGASISITFHKIMQQDRALTAAQGTGGGAEMAAFHLNYST